MERLVHSTFSAFSASLFSHIHMYTPTHTLHISIYSCTSRIYTCTDTNRTTLLQYTSPHIAPFPSSQWLFTHRLPIACRHTTHAHTFSPILIHTHLLHFHTCTPHTWTYMYTVNIQMHIHLTHTLSSTLFQTFFHFNAHLHFNFLSQAPHTSGHTQTCTPQPRTFPTLLIPLVLHAPWITHSLSSASPL